MSQTTKAVNQSAAKKRSFLDLVEALGNKMPHPFVLFLWLTLIVVVLSAILSTAGVSAIHPATGEALYVKNFLSAHGLRYLLLNFVSNFQSMPILGSVLSLSIASGVCEMSGFFDSAIKMGLKNAKGIGIVIVVAFVGVLSNAAGDAAWVLIPPIAGMIFYGAGRHPLAGMFCGYAAVAGGFATEIVPGYDMLIVPVTNEAAKMIDPGFSIGYLTAYFALFISAFFVTIIVSFVTVKFIEPRLGTYTGKPEGIVNTGEIEVTPLQRKGVRNAVIALIVYFALIVISCIPKNSFMRSDTGSLIFDAPLMDGMLFLILALFLIPGVTYGLTVKKISRIGDFIDMLVESAKQMAPFIVMLFAIAQFIRIFSDSNIGAMLAVKGGELLKASNMPPTLIIVCFIILVAFINIFIGSAGTKWMLLGPVFVPMLMQLNFHPAFIQFAYRLGDCSTNPLTPLMAYMVIMLTYAKKYDKNAGMGTIISNMAVYSGFLLVFACIYAVVWMLTGLPVGINGPIYLS